MRKKTLEEKVDSIAKEVSMHTKAIGRLEEKTSSLEKTTNKIADIVVDHGEKIKNLVTREEFNEKMNQFQQGQDKIITIVTRLDQERIFADERFRRLEEKVFK